MTGPEIIQEFLRIDEQGDDVDFAAVAESLVMRVSPAERIELVREAVRVLPASLLATFMEGALDTGQFLPQLNQALLAALPEAREISTGGIICRLLREEYRMPASELATKLQHALGQATSPTGRQAVEYAIFCLNGQRT